MSPRARAAALLPVWVLVAAAALPATLAWTIVSASRRGCLESALADLVSVGSIAGVGFALAALLLVAAVPVYRSGAAAGAATGAFALSVHAVVTFLSQDVIVCSP